MEGEGISVEHMDNLRNLLDIGRIDRMPNACFRVLCDMKKRVDERTEGSVL